MPCIFRSEFAFLLILVFFLFYLIIFFFFFNDTATTEIYTLSLHDALPIWWHRYHERNVPGVTGIDTTASDGCSTSRSEEHTSELQSPDHLVCRLLLEKKNHTTHKKIIHTQNQDNSSPIYPIAIYRTN